MNISKTPVDPAAGVRAAIDILVYAPIGLGAMIVEDMPDAIRAARRELSNARFIGRFAVDRGVSRMRTQRESTPFVAPPPVREPVQQVVVTESDHTSSIVAHELALPDYDTLPAIDIVAKLATLDADERRAIGDYESAHRQRRTILGKLAQLASG